MLNPLLSYERDILFNKLLIDIDEHNCLPENEKVFVLKLVIHKIEENNNKRCEK